MIYKTREEAFIELPDHACSLSITHNQHRDMHETVEDYIKYHGERFDWESEEHKQRAIDSDNIWELQWYPNTPVGFNCVAAPTLVELLAWANQYGEV